MPTNVMYEKIIKKSSYCSSTSYQSSCTRESFLRTNTGVKPISHLKSGFLMLYCQQGRLCQSPVNIKFIRLCQRFLFFGWHPFLIRKEWPLKKKSMSHNYLAEIFEVKRGKQRKRKESANGKIPTQIVS